MAAAGAIAGLFGGMMSAVMSAAEAKKQRDFIEEMDNTKYQRTMNDMRRAGLNPMLAYSQGANTVPAGGIANVPDFGQNIAAGMSSSAKTAEAGIKGDKKAHEIELLEAQIAAEKWRGYAAQGAGKKAEMETVLMSKDLPRKQAEAEYDQTNRELIKTKRESEIRGGIANDILGPVGSAIGALRRGR